MRTAMGTPQTHSILVVDDEPRALELVVRTLRKLGRVVTAPSGDAARELVASDRFDLVISDQRMPGISGVDLLGFVAERDESCGRILLTGYADLEATVEAINRGRVHAYLHKPCTADELRATAQGTLSRVSLARENARLLSVVAEQGEPGQDASPRAAASLRGARAAANETLAGVGRLLSSIARELQAPLEALRVGGDAAESVERICAELLDAARASEGAPSLAPAPIDRLVADAVADLIDSASRDAVKIELDLRAEASIPADANRIRVAIRHLARNAIAAMPDGGLLRIATRAAGDCVEIAVVDGGAGIPAAIEACAFEPFVAAGPAGGPGLGLAIVRKVIEQHGGAIAVAKAQGGGTAFQVTLPAVAAASA
jgi:signal transduction histidine kinase